LWCRAQLSQADARLPVNFFAGKTSEIVELTDCSLMKSGSVSLELMARGKPAAVMYHVSPSTYFLGRMLVKCESISLPNLIAGEPILEECISYGSTQSQSAQRAIQEITREVSRLIADGDYRLSKRNRLRELASKYAKPGASEKAGRFIIEKLRESGIQESDDYVRKIPIRRAA
jgi:lipid-A-disaccharide synthase